eukprot:GHVP01011682.1.p1 GENE.GHVP01011682.1~~GHVP01011682.1.p1  ORF type:complete len:112 (+),score=20.56 GHVP01011682.1:234-569(+)
MRRRHPLEPRIPDQQLKQALLRLCPQDVQIAVRRPCLNPRLSFHLFASMVLEEYSAGQLHNVLSPIQECGVSMVEKRPRRDFFVIEEMSELWQTRAPKRKLQNLAIEGSLS